MTGRLLTDIKYQIEDADALEERDATAAQRLATFVSSVDLALLPDDVVQSVKLQLLDTLGVGLAAHALGAGRAAQAAMDEVTGSGAATVIGSTRPLAPGGAALVNGTLFHALDFDDTHAGSICHVSAVVCAAALASCEVAGAGGPELVCALAAGTETAVRIGLISAVPVLERGFHPTSVFGVFGAAAAAARVAKLSPDATTSALGIAGSLASGVFAFLTDGTETKPLHAGFAAASGITAAALAREGAEGPPSIVEGRFGLFAAYAGLDDVETGPQLHGLGLTWETPNVAFKPYPACHFIHGAVHVAGRLAAEASLDPEDVEQVLLSVPSPAVAVVLEPMETKQAPRTPYEAKFSLQYSVAAMLVRGVVDISSYTQDAIRDPAVLELAKLVSYETREYATYPSAYPAGVRIRTKSGDVLEGELLYQPGSAENPLPEPSVREKFRGNAAIGLSDREVESLETAVLALESLDDLGAMLEPLRHARSLPAEPENRGRDVSFAAKEGS